MLLSPSDALEFGIQILNVKAKTKEQKEIEFRKHYGSSSLDIAEMWYDLLQLKKEAKLKEKERGERGFKRFLIAMYWLWTYPKNTSMTASRFGICKEYCKGESLWKWISRIALLKDKKIKWDQSLDSADTEIFTVSADGIDFRTWEKKHPLYNLDRKACSHKFKSCAAKYLIVLSIYSARCVMISGPYIGGVSDLNMFIKSGLMDKLKRSGKVAMVDKGFRADYASDRKHHSYPNSFDSKELHNFKSRCRLWQETFNHRIKHFAALEHTFRHGFEKHKIVFEAVVTIVQYQMDNGAPVYSV